MQSTLFHRMAVGLTSLMISGLATASDWAERSDHNLRPGVTAVAQEVHGLHNTVLWIVSIIGLLVFGLILISMIRHRRSKHPTPATFHENIFLEVLWTIIPFIILIAMAVPATRVLIELDDTADSELTVKVTGYRWRWGYEYLTYQDDNDVGVSFISSLATPPEQYENPVLSGGLFPYGTAKDRVGTPPQDKDHNYMLEVDNPLVIPSGQKVRFLVTSDDVIHSFWIPDFGGKKDAIPGFVNETWALVPEGEEGTYYGQCAELCGKNHAFMPIMVNVVTQDEFQDWLAQKKEEAAAAPDLTPFESLDAAMEVGEKVYASNCALCHGQNGEGGIGLPFAGDDFAIKPEHREEHIHVVLEGRNAMPAFKGQLTPKDIAAVITYERNAWGNDSGDLIQPEDVHEEE
ncbi:Cytochrome c oxidase subunit 2 [Alloalcanivorax dieselolei B5]|uniref:Cytochrome c oxidase subunit 2 n=2 Tax=Alloalcanivorax TaxID=3020832 RepID=K0CCX8_ALCDB|nr:MULTISPECIES: cytochrome c oxidase subunit II [Alloalcanivorax]AFT69421.1 Cytochrome c oxidase subunit 2 [Alloalcanivorax dieselolei B5]MCU5781313.1 cytochrome c oxidase subunit II [Alloalcanivorax balearicus MACL04]